MVAAHSFASPGWPGGEPGGRRILLLVALGLRSLTLKAPPGFASPPGLLLCLRRRLPFRFSIPTGAPDEYDLTVGLRELLRCLDGLLPGGQKQAVPIRGVPRQVSGLGSGPGYAAHRDAPAGPDRSAVCPPPRDGAKPGAVDLLIRFMPIDGPGFGSLKGWTGSRFPEPIARHRSSRV